MQLVFEKLVYHGGGAIECLYMYIDCHEITWVELYGFDKPACGGKAEAMECMLKGAPGGN